jgi:hypothetical protein
MRKALNPKLTRLSTAVRIHPAEKIHSGLNVLTMARHQTWSDWGVRSRSAAPYRALKTSKPTLHIFNALHCCEGCLRYLPEVRLSCMGHSYVSTDLRA